MNLRDTYNRIAKDWHQDHSQDDWWRNEEMNKFVSFLPKNGKVLDVGCGSGVKSKYLAGIGFSVVGIDFSEKFIAIAKREVPEASFQVVDIHDTSEIHGIFDGIFMQAVLLHFPKVEVLPILQSLLTKLRPGGIIYVAVKEIRADQPEEAILKENDYGYPYERFFSYFTLDEVENYFKKLGLEILSSGVKRVRKTGWIQVIGKKI